VDAAQAIALLLADPQVAPLLTDTRRTALAARIVDTGDDAAGPLPRFRDECDRFNKIEVD
jgi:hypothetical protein